MYKSEIPTFGTFLKYLLTITKVKSKELASYLSYDPSYISKWIHDKNLPSNSEILNVIEDISSFFAKRIYLSDIQNDIQKLTDNRLILNSEVSVQLALSNIVRDSYYTTLVKNPLSNKHEKMNFTVVDQNLIDEKTSNLIRFIVSSAQQDTMDIYISLRSFDIFNDRNFNSYTFFSTKNLTCNLHIAISSKWFKLGLEDIFSFIESLFALAMFNTTVYLDCENICDNFIYLKDHALLSYLFNPYGKPILLNATDSSNVLTNIENVCKMQFLNRNILFQSTSYQLCELENLLIAKLNKSPIIILAQYFNWFFLKRNTFEKFVKKKKLKRYILDWTYDSLETVYDMLNAGIEINVIFNFDNLLYLASSDSVSFYGNNVTIDYDDIYAYCNDLADLIDRYENFSVYSLNNLPSLTPLNSYNINVFISKSTVYIKKNDTILSNRDDKFVYSNDREVCADIYNAINKVLKRQDSLYMVDGDMFLEMVNNSIKIFENTHKSSITKKR